MTSCGGSSLIVGGGAVSAVARPLFLASHLAYRDGEKEGKELLAMREPKILN